MWRLSKSTLAHRHTPWLLIVKFNVPLPHDPYSCCSIQTKIDGVDSSYKLDAPRQRDQAPSTTQQKPREFTIETKLFYTQDILGVPYQDRYKKAIQTMRMVVSKTNPVIHCLLLFKILISFNNIHLYYRCFWSIKIWRKPT